MRVIWAKKRLAFDGQPCVVSLLRAKATAMQPSESRLMTSVNNTPESSVLRIRNRLEQKEKSERRAVRASQKAKWKSNRRYTGITGFLFIGSLSFRS